MNTNGSQLNIGDRVEVKRIDTVKNMQFTSQILDIVNEDILIISGPIHKTHIVPVRLDSTFEVTYIKEDKGRFMFNAVVVDRIVEGIYKLKIKKTTKTIKFQERDFYRLSTSIKVNKVFNLLDKSDEKRIEEDCVAKDISGGGIKILCNYNHSTEDIVNIKFNIDNHEISSDGEIIRIEKSNNLGYIYELGIRFINLKNTDRDNIIRFIFEQQRKNRRKELM